MTTDAKELVRRLCYYADPDYQAPSELLKESAAFIEAHDRPPLSREEMREMLMEKFGTKFVGPNEFFELALAFGEAIQRHFMGGE